MTETRARAAAIVAEIARRSSDPDRVAALTTEANGGENAIFGDVPYQPWDPGDLGHGPGALAMLYAELSHTDEGCREVAHRYLTLTTAGVASAVANGPLEGGVGGLAVAVRCAAEGRDDYQSALCKLDHRMSEQAMRLVEAHRAARAAGELGHVGLVDSCSGLAGVGRYLLHRRRQTSTALGEVLARLCALGDPLEVDGRPLPGWAADGSIRMGTDPSVEVGQVDFGLAHGMAGPLALLALAWSEGERVPGQAEAITAMADWLVDQRQVADWGPYWPSYLSVDALDRGPSSPRSEPARPSWCYGAAATARALDLAGCALSRSDWSRAAVETARAMARRPIGTWGVVDDTFCHGWAGCLHTLGYFAERYPESGFEPAVERLADTIVEHYDPDAIFGYRAHLPAYRQYHDHPGLMDGAAGVALALHRYVRGEPPASGWDSALLLR